MFPDTEMSFTGLNINKENDSTGASLLTHVRVVVDHTLPI